MAFLVGLLALVFFMVYVGITVGSVWLGIIFLTKIDELELPGCMVGLIFISGGVYWFVKLVCLLISCLGKGVLIWWQ